MSIALNIIIASFVVYVAVADDDFALRWSARFGHLEVVRLFLENGAKQSKLFEVWNKQQIMKEFFEIENC